MSKYWKEEAIRLATTTDMSWRAIAAELGVPKSTVSDYLRSIKDKLEIAREIRDSGRTPKILVFDIENTPLKGYFFNMFKTNVCVDAVEQHQYILTWAAKWLGDDFVMSDKLTNYPRFDEDVTDDYHIVKSLRDLVEEADMLIYHNGDRHDLPWLNTRMAAHGLSFISPHKVVDTLKVLKRHFRLPSNSLKYAAKYFGLELKLENEGINLWIRCMNGDRKAFDEMEEYNIGDLFPLEELYMLARPFITNHPNLALYDETLAVKRCPVCFSKGTLENTGKYAYTAVSKFELYHCTHCNASLRGRKNVLTKEQRENVLTNAR